MALTIRPEAPADYRAVEELTRRAFMAPGSPGFDGEHYLVHVLRGLPGFVPQLDFVAEDGGRLVGHVVYSRAKIVSDAGAETGVLTFGPLSVLPEHQGRGWGGR